MDTAGGPVSLLHNTQQYVLFKPNVYYWYNVIIYIGGGKPVLFEESPLVFTITGPHGGSRGVCHEHGALTSMVSVQMRLLYHTSAAQVTVKQKGS